MDQPLDNAFDPTHHIARHYREQSGDYDLRRLPRPEGMGTRYAPGTVYDALSDAYCAPEGMGRDDSDYLPGVTWRRVSSRPTPSAAPAPIPEPTPEEVPDDGDPLGFWVGLRNAFGIVATLVLIWLILWLMFGPGGH